MSTQPRDPTEVIKAILEVLPADRESLRRRLCRISDDAAYMAPEVEQLVWQQIANALGHGLPDPSAADSPDWVRRISDIVQGRA